MKYRSALQWIIPLIAVLALFAVGIGLFYQTSGDPYSLTSFRGEQVTINGHGLYHYDTVSTVAQMQGNDIITLLVGLPLLIISAWLAFHGSLRGRLLMTGTLAFFLYTYMSMSMLTAYNSLFLVYVALFGLSLYGFILAMLSFDLEELPAHFSPGLPRGWIAGVLGIIPALGLIGLLIALYGIYLLYLGLPRLMKTPPEKAMPYTIVVIIVGIVISLIVGAVSAVMLPGRMGGF